MHVGAIHVCILMRILPRASPVPQNPSYLLISVKYSIIIVVRYHTKSEHREHEEDQLWRGIERMLHDQHRLRGTKYDAVKSEHCREGLLEVAKTLKLAGWDPFDPSTNIFKQCISHAVDFIGAPLTTKALKELNDYFNEVIRLHRVMEDQSPEPVEESIGEVQRYHRQQVKSSIHGNRNRVGRSGKTSGGVQHVF